MFDYSPINTYPCTLPGATTNKKKWERESHLLVVLYLFLLSSELAPPHTSLTRHPIYCVEDQESLKRQEFSRVAVSFFSLWENMMFLFYFP